MPFCCVMRGNRFRIQYPHTKSVHHSLNFVFYQYNLFVFALLEIIKKSSARSESSQFIIFFPNISFLFLIKVFYLADFSFLFLFS